MYMKECLYQYFIYFVIYLKGLYMYTIYLINSPITYAKTKKQNNLYKNDFKKKFWSLIKVAGFH